MLEEGLEGSLELSIKMRKKLNENKWDQMTKKQNLLKKAKKRSLFKEICIHSPW